MTGLPTGGYTFDQGRQRSPDFASQACIPRTMRRNGFPLTRRSPARIARSRQRLLDLFESIIQDLGGRDAAIAFLNEIPDAAEAAAPTEG